MVDAPRKANLSLDRVEGWRALVPIGPQEQTRHTSRSIENASAVEMAEQRTREQLMKQKQTLLPSPAQMGDVKLGAPGAQSRFLESVPPTNVQPSAAIFLRCCNDAIVIGLPRAPQVTDESSQLVSSRSDRSATSVAIDTAIFIPRLVPAERVADSPFRPAAALQ